MAYGVISKRKQNRGVNERENQGEKKEREKLKDSLKNYQMKTIRILLKVKKKMQ